MNAQEIAFENMVDAQEVLEATIMQLKLHYADELTFNLLIEEIKTARTRALENQQAWLDTLAK